ncbi:hypothetical protein Ciccas_013786, partial [Cichlidogyrus casuarinus]
MSFTQAWDQVKKWAVRDEEIRMEREVNDMIRQNGEKLTPRQRLIRVQSMFPNDTKLQKAVFYAGSRLSIQDLVIKEYLTSGVEQLEDLLSRMNTREKSPHAPGDRRQRCHPRVTGWSVRADEPVRLRGFNGPAITCSQKIKLNISVGKNTLPFEFVLIEGASVNIIGIDFLSCEHTIESVGRPVYAKARKLRKEREVAAKLEKEKLIAAGKVRPANSEWCSPMLTVPKPDGT